MRNDLKMKMKNKELSVIFFTKTSLIRTI